MDFRSPRAHRKGSDQSQKVSFAQAKIAKIRATKNKVLNGERHGSKMAKRIRKHIQQISSYFFYANDRKQQVENDVLETHDTAEDELQSLQDSDSVASGAAVDSRPQNSLEHFNMQSINHLMITKSTKNCFLDGEDGTGVRTRIRKVLKTAGEKGINYFDTTIESHHEDDALRAVHALLYFRYHKVDEKDYREFITSERIASKSNLYDLHRIRGQNYNADKQQAIMDFYLNGQSESGGANWWQIFIRTTFVLTADLTLKYRFMIDDDKKYECFKKWCAVPSLEEIEALELKDEKDISVRSTEPYDQGKARRVIKVDLDFGDPNVSDM
ncbi:hypothetical protein G7Y79_00006g018950 [Physcia stellaris]|nr:hypothetical protein G7Y79_00006g018950 [Physcia stellaris]